MCTKDVLVLSWIINYVSAEQKNPHESVHINRVDIVLKTVHYALFLQLYAEQYTVFVSMLHSLLPTICRTVSCNMLYLLGWQTHNNIISLFLCAKSFSDTFLIALTSAIIHVVV